MEFQTPLCLSFLLFSLLVSSSQAHKFYVGGSKGWVPNPSESYNLWAGRNRFQIKDTIVFKYNKGSDSVLQVKKEDFDKCNKTNPIKKFEDGDTEFTFDRSGPFYFISGKDGNCEKGQKMILVVISPRGTQPPPSPPPKSSPSPSPSPKVSPPSGSPPTAVSPSPAGTPPSVLPSPAGAPVPAGGPSTGTPPSISPSPSPVSTPPAGGPTANSPAPGAESPSSSPISNPPAGGPTTASPSPAGTSPAGGPPAPSPTTVDSPPSGSGPGASPSGSPSSSSNNSTTPPPGNSGSSVAPSSFLRYSVTIVVGAALLRYGTVLG